ncbi:major facilitator superfamily protein [Burkholderia pseudomultivorans]|uniref:Major facilitator superfamily protein n=1 Tax=Burkholderia pseudomultivorans TaxID=1207504 RepID=A0A6P2MBC9_9BURK|nr:hypothetical protein [Burkholderia pseudomultivorans]VWB79102.1 major facilitator superfamily protein [Burkholderia pseudomultivorans]
MVSIAGSALAVAWVVTGAPTSLLPVFGENGRAVVAPTPAAQLGPILSEVVLRAAVAPRRADRHWRLAVDASPFPA